MKPITPDEVVEAKLAQIPNSIIEIVNGLLTKNYNQGSGSATIKVKDIKAEYLGEDPFDNNWLDFKDIYRGAGWWVTFDRPAYFETYDAYFEFKKRL